MFGHKPSGKLSDMHTKRDSLGRAAATADEPDWRPLFRAVGEDLMPTFMWMYEVRVPGVPALQAYKHIHTRRYLHLDARANAFVYIGKQSYRPIALATVLELVLAPWWDGLGATADDALAAWAAIDRAHDSDGEGRAA